MSRIGKLPITIPAGVTVDFKNNIITLKGPLGELKQEVKDVDLKIENNTITLSRKNDTKELKAKHGLYRALINNMVTGVTKGYEKSLIVNGVGYKAAVESDKLTLYVGFSHTVDFKIPSSVKVECPTITEILVKGISKTEVGQVAANIRAIKKVEPYHLYGIRYKDEIIQKKEGKTAGK